MLNKLETKLKTENRADIASAGFVSDDVFSEIIEDSLDDDITDMFPDVYDATKLKTDLKLPVIKFNNFKDTLHLTDNSFTFEIELPGNHKYVDIYLYVNDKKRDMFFHCGSGNYSFPNVKFSKGANQVEFFYKAGNKRSQSVYCIVNNI